MNEDSGELWGIALYIGSLVGELPAIIARAFILLIFVELYFLLASVPLTSQGDQLSSLGWWIFLIAIYPVLFSLATLLFLPSGGGLLMRQEMNARKPSDRERNAISQALDVLTVDRPGVERPKRFYVVNALDQNAYVVGTTLYVAKGLFDTPWFIPMIAHELGHLNSLDGRLILAVRRMVFPGLFRFGGYILRTQREDFFTWLYGLLFGLLMMVLSGGMGLALLSSGWRWYWRSREYAADDYAASLGQAMPMADYLGRYLYLDIVLPYVGSYHPPAEYRIDRLLSYEERRAAVEERIAARVQRREEWTARRERIYQAIRNGLANSGLGRWLWRERERQRQGAIEYLKTHGQQTDEAEPPAEAVPVAAIIAQPIMESVPVEEQPVTQSAAKKRKVRTRAVRRAGTMQATDGEERRVGEQRSSEPMEEPGKAEAGD